MTQKSEVEYVFQQFGIVEEHMSRRVGQILYLLEKLGLVKGRNYGNNTYYVPWKARLRYLDYTSSNNKHPFKRDRFKTQLLEELEKDKFRKSVWSRWKLEHIDADETW